MALKLQYEISEFKQHGLFFVLLVLAVSCSAENDHRTQFDENTVEIMNSIENLKNKVNETRMLIDSIENSNTQTNIIRIEKIQAHTDSQEIKIIRSSAE
jgi:glutaredoxin-related protein